MAPTSPIVAIPFARAHLVHLQPPDVDVPSIVAAIRAGTIARWGVWTVPLDERTTIADYVSGLSLPVLVVAWPDLSPGNGAAAEAHLARVLNSLINAKGTRPDTGASLSC